LAERLGCQPEELVKRGFFVHSAGLAAMIGDTAATEAIAAVKERGADLTAHQAKPLTPELVYDADHLIVMAERHLLSIAARFPGAGAAPRLLTFEGEDLADPIGCDQDVYEHCAREIERHLQRLVSDLLTEEQRQS